MDNSMDDYSASLIEDRLYLGDMSNANDQSLLNALNIKCILSVFDDNLNHNLKTITYKKIPVGDNSLEDLITYFPETNEFIGWAHKSGHNVLVHCHAGVSRSTTVVVAFLMNKYRITYEEAFDLVRQRRRFVGPNPGFVSQLRLYHQMEYRLDANNRRLRQILVESHLNYVMCWSKPRQQMDHYFNRRDLIEGQTQDLECGRQYLCAKCGHKLFDEIHVIENEVSVDTKQCCEWTYIEPQKWMRDSFQKSNNAFVVRCVQCKQIVVQYKKNYLKYRCECPLHESIGLNQECLKFRIQNNKFKIK